MGYKKYTKFLLALFACLIPAQLFAEPNGAAQETSILLLLFGILFAGGTLVLLAVTVTGFILKQKPPLILLKIGLGANILWTAIFALMFLAMLTGNGNKSQTDMVIVVMGFVGMGAGAFMNFRQVTGK